MGFSIYFWPYVGIIEAVLERKKFVYFSIKIVVGLLSLNNLPEQNNFYSLYQRKTIFGGILG